MSFERAAEALIWGEEKSFRTCIAARLRKDFSPRHPPRAHRAAHRMTCLIYFPFQNTVAA